MVKDLLEDFTNSTKRGAASEIIMKEALNAMEEPLKKIPADVRDWVKQMVEESLRFGLEHGQSGTNHILDMITAKYGDEVKPVIEAVKAVVNRLWSENS